MANKIFDAELRVIFPEALRKDFEIDASEPFAQISKHPEAEATHPLWTIESVIKEMNRSAVGMGLLSGLPWNNKKWHDRHNQYIKQCIVDYPHRFKGLYSLYLDSVESAVEQIYHLDQQIFTGVEIIPKWQGVHIDQQSLYPVFEAIKEKDLYLKAYTAHVTQTLDGDSPHRLLKMLLKHPDMKVLVPHLGGLLCLYRLMPGLESAFINTWFISSVSATMLMTKFAMEVNSDNILFGTDFPFNHGHSIQQSIDQVREILPDQSVLDKLLWSNAESIFNLDAEQ